MYCTGCGEEYNETDRYCVNCGKSFVKSEIATTLETTPIKAKNRNKTLSITIKIIIILVWWFSQSILYQNEIHQYDLFPNYNSFVKLGGAILMHWTILFLITFAIAVYKTKMGWKKSIKTILVFVGILLVVAFIFGNSKTEYFGIVTTGMVMTYLNLNKFM